MTQNNITLVILAVLVVFFLPALYRKRKNSNLISQEKSRIFPGRQPEVKTPSPAESVPARNGSQKDLLLFVSSLMKLVRKNRWYIIIPGQLSDGSVQTSLSVVLVTQQRVIGLKCYGYGGVIINNGKDSEWTQKLEHNTRTFRSPLPEQSAQKEALSALLPQLHSSQVEVFSVFTTPGVQLVNCSGLNCYASGSVLEKLQNSVSDRTGQLHPKELGPKLETLKTAPPSKQKK